MKLTRSLPFLLLLTVTSHNCVVCQGICRPHGVRGVSECTQGFLSAFDIEVVEGLTDLHLHSARQVLIPDMNFNCTGSITKWIFSARWEGNSPAFTELQVWRKVNDTGNIYTTVEATTIQANRSSNEMYEYPVDPPLAVQEGDILGYFQPHREISQLELYLQNSDIIVTVHDNTGRRQELPLRENFDLDAPHSTGQDYPLIGTETDPPNCGCGMVTTERMNALLTVDMDMFGARDTYPQEQVIFPTIKFTCSGRVTKWIVGATYSNGIYYPELQIWRPSGGAVYQKLNGTIAKAAGEEASRIYEFIVDPPLPFQPGDILGVFQPSEQNSRLLVDYDSGGDLLNFYLPLESGQVEPSHKIIDVSSSFLQIRREIPVVAVGLALNMPPTDTATSIQVPTTTPTVATSSYVPMSGVVSPISTHIQVTAAMTHSLMTGITPPSTTFNPSPSLPCINLYSDDMCGKPQAENNTNSTHGTVIGSVVSLSILSTAAVIAIILSVLLWSRRRKRVPKLMDNVAYCIHDTKTQTDVITANANIETTTNKAYEAISVPTSANPAYQLAASPQENVEIATAAAKNMAHVATDVLISTNPAHLCAQNTDDDNKLEYDYPQQQ